MNQSSAYLFLLGNHPTLSRAELSGLANEVLYDPQHHLLLADNLVISNPRNLPKAPEQIFLDRLGGTIWMAEVMGEFESREALVDAMAAVYKKSDRDGVQYLGMNYYGHSKQFWPDFLYQAQKELSTRTNKKFRLENPNGKNIDSGRVFNSKLLRKGNFFIVWQQKNTFLLANVCALQNLRNYGLRDYGKDFRDAHMGMMSPKLAQILINIGTKTNQTLEPNRATKIIDPFCGSGTINAEAAIMGFSTIGSDLQAEHVDGAKKNYQFLSEKFRFDVASGVFLTEDALKMPWGKTSGLIVTEGWLGKNFVSRPLPADVRANAQTIMTMWEKFFRNLAATAPNIETVVFCVPAWLQRTQLGMEYLSITEKIFAKIKPFGYISSALNSRQKTYKYYRPDAFVAREICVVQKQK